RPLPPRRRAQRPPSAALSRPSSQHARRVGPRGLQPNSPARSWRFTAKGWILARRESADFNPGSAVPIKGELVLCPLRPFLFEKKLGVAAARLLEYYQEGEGQIISSMV